MSITLTFATRLLSAYDGAALSLHICDRGQEPTSYSEALNSSIAVFPALAFGAVVAVPGVGYKREATLTATSYTATGITRSVALVDDDTATLLEVRAIPVEDQVGVTLGQNAEVVGGKLVALYEDPA